jgi:hypothetical protein
MIAAFNILQNALDEQGRSQDFILGAIGAILAIGQGRG